MFFDLSGCTIMVVYVFLFTLELTVFVFECKSIYIYKLIEIDAGLISNSYTEKHQ